MAEIQRGATCPAALARREEVAQRLPSLHRRERSTEYVLTTLAELSDDDDDE